jgi:hypothetical protein
MSSQRRAVLTYGLAARPEQAFESFEEAIKINDKDPDM